MKGLWLENKQLRLRDDLPTPPTPPHESLVRVIQAGICNTDLEMLDGYYPFVGILGHEFVGIVEQGPSRLIGQRVVGEINTWCGDCSTCRRGLTTHCEHRTVLGIADRHGAFAEYLTLPCENLHLVPDRLSTDSATFTEPLAAAIQIQTQISIEPDDRVLVVGNGKLGQLIAQTLALTGCHLDVIGRGRRQTDPLRKRHIATRLADEVEPSSYDIAVECTGNPEGFALALRGLRPRGSLVLKSTYSGNLDLDASQLVVKEITVTGSRCGPFGPALRLLAEGAIEVEPLIDSRFPLAQGLAAFAQAAEPGALKVLLEIGDDDH
jgi:threonine dehydrogenase-like Zn-dependent dehydrogenase